MLKQKNESMPSVRPRGRNVKSGNLLPLILRDVIFGNCCDNTVQNTPQSNLTPQKHYHEC